MDRGGDESTGDGYEAYIEDKLMDCVQPSNFVCTVLYMQVLAHIGTLGPEKRHSERSWLLGEIHSARASWDLVRDGLGELKKTPAYVVASQLAVLGIYM
jgi:hypothetical protein